jgi:hypothetical protein
VNKTRAKIEALRAAAALIRVHTETGEGDLWLESQDESPDGCWPERDLPKIAQAYQDIANGLLAQATRLEERIAAREARRSQAEAKPATAPRKD